MKKIHIEFDLIAEDFTTDKLFNRSEEILQERIMEALDAYYKDEHIDNFIMYKAEDGL